MSKQYLERAEKLKDYISSRKKFHQKIQQKLKKIYKILTFLVVKYAMNLMDLNLFWTVGICHFVIIVVKIFLVKLNQNVLFSGKKLPKKCELIFNQACFVKAV